jgi:hypothetical protein
MLVGCDAHHSQVPHAWDTERLPAGQAAVMAPEVGFVLPESAQGSLSSQVGQGKITCLPLTLAWPQSGP